MRAGRAERGESAILWVAAPERAIRSEGLEQEPPEEEDAQDDDECDDDDFDESHGQFLKVENRPTKVCILSALGAVCQRQVEGHQRFRGRVSFQ